MRETVINWLISILRMNFTLVKIRENTVKAHKKHDCTKFTRQDFDVIMEDHAQYVFDKKLIGTGCRITLDDLVNVLNSKLGYDKTRSAYTRVWTGKVTRESLGEVLDVRPIESEVQ